MSINFRTDGFSVKHADWSHCVAVIEVSRGHYAVEVNENFADMVDHINNSGMVKDAGRGIKDRAHYVRWTVKIGRIYDLSAHVEAI